MVFDLLAVLKNKKLFLVGVAVMLFLSLVVGEKIREKIYTYELSTQKKKELENLMTQSSELLEIVDDIDEVKLKKGFWDKTKKVVVFPAVIKEKRGEEHRALIAYDYIGGEFVSPRIVIFSSVPPLHKQVWLGSSKTGINLH